MQNCTSTNLLQFSHCLPDDIINTINDSITEIERFILKLSHPTFLSRPNDNDYIDIPTLISYQIPEVVDLIKFLTKNKNIYKYIDHIISTNNLEFVKMLIPPNSINYENLIHSLNGSKFLTNCKLDILLYLIDHTDKKIHQLFSDIRRVDILYYYYKLYEEDITSIIRKRYFFDINISFEFAKLGYNLGVKIDAKHYISAVNANDINFTKWVIDNLSDYDLNYICSISLIELKISQENKEVILWLYENNYLPPSSICKMCKTYSIPVPENILRNNNENLDIAIYQMSMNDFSNLSFAFGIFDVSYIVQALFYVLKYEQVRFYCLDIFYRYIDKARAILKLPSCKCDELYIDIMLHNSKYVLLKFIDKYIDNVVSEVNLELLKLLQCNDVYHIDEIFYIYEQEKKDVFFYMMENFKISLNTRINTCLFSELCIKNSRFAEACITQLKNSEEVIKQYNINSRCIIKYFSYKSLLENLKTVLENNISHINTINFIIKYRSDSIFLHYMKYILACDVLTEHCLYHNKLILYYAFRYGLKRAEYCYDILLKTNKLRTVDHYCVSNMTKNNNNFLKWMITKDFVIDKTYNLESLMSTNNIAYQYIVFKNKQ